MCLGVPGRIEAIRDEQGTPMASVDFGGIRKDVCLAYLPEAEVGDYTLVHVGFAITRIDEANSGGPIGLGHGFTGEVAKHIVDLATQSINFSNRVKIATNNHD